MSGARQYDTITFANDREKALFRQFVEELLTSQKYTRIIAYKAGDRKDYHATFNAMDTCEFNYCLQKRISPDLVDYYVSLFTHHPEQMQFAVLESVSMTKKREEKGYRIEPHRMREVLTPVYEEFHLWAMQDKEKATLVLTNPVLYKYSKENVDRNMAKSNHMMSTGFAVMCFVGAIVLVGMAVAVPGVGAVVMGIFAAFYFGMGFHQAHFAKQCAKKKHLSPLTDKVNPPSKNVPSSNAMQQLYAQGVVGEEKCHSSKQVSAIKPSCQVKKIVKNDPVIQEIELQPITRSLR